MNIILVPGLWLDASSWGQVAPALERAGHTVHALTMPGVGAPAAQSSEIGIADWVAAVVDEIDRIGRQVVLVGHSGGGNVVYGAADARPERIARIVFVDTFPPGDGGSIWQFPVVDGVVPFPGWDAFEDVEIADLDADTRDSLSGRMQSVPAQVPTDQLRLRDPRRRSIPVTMLAGIVSAAEVQGFIDEAADWASELAAIEDLDVVELHSGHWPQFSRPQELAAALLAAVQRTEA